MLLRFSIPSGGAEIEGVDKHGITISTNLMLGQGEIVGCGVSTVDEFVDIDKELDTKYLMVDDKGNIRLREFDSGPRGEFRMPKHFRFKIDCKECEGSLDADGHHSMSCLDAWLSAHVDEVGHKKYTLEIE